MSTTKYKTALRIKLKYPTPNDSVINILDKMGLDYDLWESGDVSEIKDDNWDIAHGTQTGNTYLDYVIAENDYDNPFFDGVLGMNEIEDKLQMIPSEFMPEIRDVRIVSYGYYTGVDEPEIFE